MGNFVSNHEDPSDSMDILAAIFFVVAGIWLLLAMSYSLMIVWFLRMRARGQLDTIYDEDFGRIYLPSWTNSSNSDYRFYIPAGCIFRRYMHHLQQEQQRQQRQPSSMSLSSRTETPVAPLTAARYMTTEERRRAMEVLLWEELETLKTVDSCCDCAAPVALPVPASSEPTSTDVDVDADAGTADQDSDLEEVRMCTICLDEFTTEADATVLHSPTCSHCFHKDCIMDWLQRHGTSECPCCRTAMITEDEVWEAVQRLRKERRAQLRRETVWSYFLPNKQEEKSAQRNNNGHQTAENSENTDNDDDAIMVSPTLSSDSTSSEEEDADSPADANV